MSRTPGQVLPLCAAVAFGTAAWLLPSSPAGGQAPGKPPRPPAEKGPPVFSHVVTLPTNRELEEALAVIPEYIKGKEPRKAAEMLQWVLDQPEDAFVPVPRQGPEGKPVFGWVSARQQANRLLGALPDKALEAYAVDAGPRASALLQAALKDFDLLALAHVADRYRHTTAGRQAVERMGSHYLARGQYATAARYFRRLLLRPNDPAVTPQTLIKATLAFRRARDAASAAQAWKLLRQRVGDRVQIGERFVPLKELDRKLSASPAPSWVGVGEQSWPLFRGAPGRTASAAGKVTGLAAGWRRPTAEGRFVPDWLEDAVGRLGARREPVLPAAVPLALSDRVIYRSHRGVEAVERATGRLLWSSSPLRGSLEELADDAPSRAHAGPWVASLLQSFPHALIENGTLGWLSADERLVYAVEDLAIPPVPANWQAFYHKNGAGLELDHAAQLTEAIYHSRLIAFELESGKAVWTAGFKDDKWAGALKGVHFLGPPLPLGGKLYGLVEKQQVLALVCLDPADGRQLWAQTLATPKRNLLLDGARRMWGAQPAHGEGVLVCPTNAGAVVAVDLASRGLLWAHSYRDEPPPPMPAPPPGKFRPWNVPQPVPPFALEGKWKFSAPIVAQGKVLLAPPDGSALECLDLWTGALLWRAPREAEDLYVAGVYKGRVVVVGRSYVGAFRLETGSVLWAVETPEPAGLGVAAGDVYYLPVRTTRETGGPAVVGIRLDKGLVASRLPLPEGDVPGNLVLSQGSLLSQTATRLAAYPCERAGGK
jgi:outer membrane protein assembly factor BamB